ncbi:type II secretion system F family protein [Cellulomonas persica]|uniref:Type II secretion system protein GspF domain-containing protein n=1 Tax=Cellulomonas persica TaxID=76861 RepID=A0A510UVD2_9CELL|nr:type II secretion protein F [Cellulomonas persica]GEK17431.1 hypothetical protein CPE01_11640 [Cellulomonas persica]
MSAAVGVAVALAVLAVGGPPGRPPVRSAAAPHLDEDAPSTHPGRGLDGLLVAVAAQLRSGRAPHDAWQTALGVPLDGDVPAVEALVAACGPDGGQSRGRRSDGRRGAARRGPGPRQPGRSRGTGARARRGGVAARERQRLVERATAVVVAARTAHELGAPLVGVLERVTESLAADAAERDDLEAALAGPRATARVLGWLPLLGVALGTLLGADPVGVLLGGGLGTTAGLLGVLLLVVGRRWTAHLLASAARGASAPPRGRRWSRRPVPGRVRLTRS